MCSCSSYKRFGSLFGSTFRKRRTSRTSDSFQPPSGGISSRATKRPMFPQSSHRSSFVHRTSLMASGLHFAPPIWPTLYNSIHVVRRNGTDSGRAAKLCALCYRDRDAVWLRSVFPINRCSVTSSSTFATSTPLLPIRRNALQLPNWQTISSLMEVNFKFGIIFLSN